MEIVIEMFLLVLTICLTLLAIVKSVEHILRVCLIKNLVKQYSKVEQYYIYGYVDKLKDLDELNVWMDPALLREKHPILTEKNIEKLLKLFNKQSFDDLLYVRSNLATIIRIPKGCVITFGQGCLKYKEYPRIVIDSNVIRTASTLKTWAPSNEAKLIKTVRHLT